MNCMAVTTILRLDVPTADRARKPHPSGEATVVALIDATYDRLTSDNACVLLIDHQIGPLWELEFAEPRRRVVELAATARRLRLPTIVTAIGIDTLGPVIPELTTAFEEAPHIARTTVNAWDDERIRDAIESAGRKKLIVAGSAADVGVALCATSAIAAGYDVYVPIDASAHFSHATSGWLARAGVIVTTVSLLLKELDGAHARRPGQRKRVSP
jgi:nicotinamidase-related amidase